MLHYYHSNRMESLLCAMENIIETPLRNPFHAEMIVVQNQGAAQWLTQQIATKQGIVANVNFPLPAQFVWQLFRSQFSSIPESSAFSPESLLWRCMDLLPSLKNQPEYAQINYYLQGLDAETKLYQLCERIADLFDQYLLYRPDWIVQWEKGEADHWQAHLWRILRKSTQEPHWVDLVTRFQSWVEQGKFRKETLPERVCLFGLSALSPHYLQLLVQLARNLDVHLFLLNPSANYWGDIQSEPDLARLRGRWRRTGRADVSELFSVGNPLLASMGKQARDFLDQLHQYPAQEEESFDEASVPSLLRSIQDDILNLQTRGSEDCPVLRLPQDATVRLEICHSPMREVQVLQDQLLGLFSQHPDLLPHQVLVMASNLDQYAPYIDAVFGGTESERCIPYRIAGQSSRLDSPVVELLLHWLQLPADRLEASSVLSWLEVPAVQRKFALDEKALARIRYWVRESAIRWGFDGQHRSELDLPDWDSNSWAFGLRRLFIGMALPANVELYAGVAPFADVEGSELVWLGQLQRFIELLQKWRGLMAQSTSVEGWQRRLNRLIEDFFLLDEEEEYAIHQLRQDLSTWAEQTHHGDFHGVISATLVQQHLTKKLAPGKARSNFMSGAVTFCSMEAMAGIPARIVCLLGMNDLDFPRRQQPVGFDLIAQHPRKGDRSRRSSDRYGFLQALLAARDVFYMSYVGRSQQDNKKKEPSVVVSELLDYAARGYAFIDVDLRAALCREHPLQPFSPRNFAMGSYANEWAERQEASEEFISHPIESMKDKPIKNKSDLIELATLSQFIANPAKHFLQQRLSIQAQEFEESLEDCEPFALDHLEQYGLKDALLRKLLGKRNSTATYEYFAASGHLPQGAFGQLAFDQVLQPMAALAGKVSEFEKASVFRLNVDLSIGDIRLIGWLKCFKEFGLVQYRVNGIKAKYQLQLWVEHLACCAMGLQLPSRAIGWEKKVVEWVLLPVEPSLALDYLKELVELYLQNRTCPIPFFPESSMAYCKQVEKKNTAGALASAGKSWEGNQHARGDGEDEWFSLAFRGRDPFAEPFASLAEQVLTPLLQQVGTSK